MRRSAAFLLSGATLALVAASPASAQDVPPNPAPTPAPAPAESQEDSGEIVVTAQKRSELLRDVPISITAATGEQLTNAGVTDTSQLSRIVPGFTFQRSSYGAPIFTIRGVGFYDTAVGVSPAVSVYQDQAPVPYSVMARGVTLDLERVEVLKGPQGTLFGQNSTGGAINYIAARPTEDFNAGFDLTLGRFNQVEGQAFISGQLAPGLTARVAGRYEYRGPWQRGYAPNDVKFGQDPDAELGRRRFGTGRLLLDWRPSETIRFELNVNGWTDDSDTQAAQFVRFAPQSPLSPFNAVTYNAFVNTPPVLTTLPRDPRVAGWDPGRPFVRDDWFYQIALRGEVDLTDTISLTSITSYARFRQDATIDTDGVAYADQVVIARARIKSFSQEIRLAGEGGGFRWMVGGNYARDISRETQDSLLGSTNNGVGPFRYDRAQFRNNQDSTTWAAFASVDYALTSTLRVGVSARYTTQDRDFVGCAADPGTDGRFALAFRNVFGTAATTGNCVTMSDPVNRTLLPNVTNALNEDNFSWRANISWNPTSTSMLYANVTRGYKAGSFPVLPGVFAFQFDPVTQESVTAYEAGLRLSTSDRRLQLSAAAFYLDYRDKQILGTTVVLPFGNLPKLVNIPESRVLGAEFQVVARPVDGLRLTVGGTYVNSRVGQDPTNPVDQFGQPTTFVGEPFPNTPRWQFTGDAEYRFPLRGETEAYLGAGLTTRSSSQAAFGESPEFTIHDYALLDLRAGVDFANGMRVQVWGRNVTNKFYVNNISHLIDVVAQTTGMPATYGVTLGYRF